MPRIGQRGVLPISAQGRNLDIIQITDTISAQATLASGAGTTFTITTKSTQEIPIFTQEDISLFEGSIATANLIPNGSAIDASDYQIIGPVRDVNSGDGNNIVSKIYVRNATTGATDFTKRISQGSDDAQEENDTTLLLTVSGFGAELPNPTIGDLGLRFLDITIPQGSTINSAKISIRYLFQELNTVLAIIKGIDEDNTATWSSGNRPSQRTKTTANVTWTAPTGSAEDVKDTPDITSVVQEIVDRPGWASGNAMGFVIEDNGNDPNSDLDIDIYDYTNDSTKAALLSINYGTDTPKTVIFRGRARYITPRDDVTIS